MCKFSSKSGWVPFQPLGDLTWNDPQYKYFYNKSLFWASILRQILIKMHSKIHQIRSFFKNFLRERCLYIYKSSVTKYYIILHAPKTAHHIAPLFKIFLFDLILSTTPNPIACKHAPNHILG